MDDFSLELTPALFSSISWEEIWKEGALGSALAAIEFIIFHRISGLRPVNIKSDPYKFVHLKPKKNFFACLCPNDPQLLKSMQFTFTLIRCIFPFLNNLLEILVSLESLYTKTVWQFQPSKKFRFTSLEY